MGKNIRYLYLLFFILVVYSISGPAYSQSQHQPIITTNLAKDGETSTHSKRPILLLLSRKGCPYCILIKREIIKPMLISGDYTDKVIIRELILDATDTLHDFNGTLITSSELTNRYSIEITPTLLFLGPDGKELAERIVGINTIELFSYYVDQAIDKAILNFQSK
jgi:thioredoxin-related protein